MPLNSLQVFNDWTYGSMSEAIAQQVELFNAAVNNAIVLRVGNNTGDYSDEASWKRLAGLVINRDAYATGAVGALTLEQLLETSVKVGQATPPVSIPASMMLWIQQDPEAAGRAYGEQLAESLMQKQLNDILSVGVTAIGNVAGVTRDISLDVTPGTVATSTLGELNTTASLFGDASQKLVAWIMHSKSLFDLYGTALANAENLFTFGNVKVIQDGFGRPLVITDAPALIDTSTTNNDNYHTLGLVSEGLIVESNDDFYQSTQEVNGDVNILRTVQSEWSNNYAIQGWSWDKASGGKSPTDAELATAANWDKYASSNKNLAGVLLISN